MERQTGEPGLARQVDRRHALTNAPLDERIDRALRYRWCGVALGVAALGMMAGLPLLGAFAATTGLGIAVFRLVREEPATAGGT
jgi:hypothetical protein